MSYIATAGHELQREIIHNLGGSIQLESATLLKLKMT